MVRLLLLVSSLMLATSTPAAAPLLLHTPSFESPVRADPDDLLMIGGIGFSAGDTVVYQAYEAGSSATSTDRRPSRIPLESTAKLGTAPVVSAGSPQYAITVRLPKTLRKGMSYKLWVVSARGEWSAPVSINDPRPQWITPAYVYSTADFANLGRTVRVVGRNLATESGRSLQIRLRGPETYILQSTSAVHGSVHLKPTQLYVAEAQLPARVIPGTYFVSVRRTDSAWVDLTGQTLTVKTDPAASPSFALDATEFGSCRPDDGKDDSQCFVRALEAAARAGGGTLVVPPGHWELASASLPPATAADGFVLAPNVNLRGEGARSSFLVRKEPTSGHRRSALVTLTGHNSVSGIGFPDSVPFASWAEAQPTIQLGRSIDRMPNDRSSHKVEDIVITDNVFMHVGRALTDDASRPVVRLFITRNEFGAYTEGIALPGSQINPGEPFRIDDAVIRWNRFVPGSFVDLHDRQGAIASELGASYRVDFSSNVADGSSSEALQERADQPGFRAAFFWNMNNNIEFLLAADNKTLCSGDKDGDGEAIALDGSGDTFALNGAPAVTAAGPDWIAVSKSALAAPRGPDVRGNTDFEGHWVQVVAGPGVGQVRKITHHAQQTGEAGVTFHVEPRWDVVPVPGTTRVLIGREVWQALVIANDIEHRSPPCRKSNLSGPHGGAIVVWAPSADSVIEANQQHDTDGIVIAHSYSLFAPSCPACDNLSLVQTALQIRGNFIDGEYDWTSDCSSSGIMIPFGASPQPESPPPVLDFGTVIADNTVSAADGLRGGAIDVALTSHAGPPPGNWALLQNVLIFHNRLRDIAGSAPRDLCHYGQRRRIGIRIDGNQNVRDTIVYDNRCTRVDTAVLDSGAGTTMICPASAQDQCGCSVQSRDPTSR